jgi:hypothetical protein
MILLSRTERHANNQSEPKQSVNILICFWHKDQGESLT